MPLYWRHWLGLAVLIFGMATLVSAQKKPAIVTPPPVDPNAKRVDVRWADNLRVMQQEIKQKKEDIQKLLGHVLMKQDSVFISCDSAIIVNGVYVYAYSHVIIQQGDSLTIFSNQAEYDGLTKLSNLTGDVVLDNNGQRLFTNRLDYDVAHKIATYKNGATLANDSTQLTSKKGIYYVKQHEIYFEDDVKVVDAKFKLKADTLKYNTESKTIFFHGPTLITTDSSKIYCEAGFYDTNNNVAKFAKNAQYTKGLQEAEADTIRYEAATKLYTLDGKARVQDTTRLALADYIQYNEQQDTLFMRGQAKYQEKKQDITSEVIRYNRKTSTFATRGRSKISNPPQILQADQVDFGDQTGVGLATGNVFWQDTSGKVSIECAKALYNKDTDYLKASGGIKGRPEMISLVDQDSMFLSADTLISFRPIVQSKAKQDSIARAKKIVEDRNNGIGLLVYRDTVSAEAHQKMATLRMVAKIDSLTYIPTLQDAAKKRRSNTAIAKRDTIQKDSNRILLAYHNVRIYKKNFQAVSDSLAYSSLDSLFTFYKKPVIWSDTSQFTADTLKVLLSNKKIDRILMRSNALIINQTDGEYYNQIKGRNIVARFYDGSLRRMDSYGNAEVVYYIKDDKGAYVGVNKTSCSEMVIRIDPGNQIRKITFITTPKAVLTPMRKADHEKLKLGGFRWETEQRPKTRADIFMTKKIMVVAPPPPPLNLNR